MAQLSKRDQILKTAGAMFMRQGYSKTSMDAIAAETPVSKPTLYNHFKDKKELFAAVITERCKRLLAVVEAGIDERRPVKTVLMGIAQQFLQMILSPEALNMHRIVSGEAREFPEMAKLFYESGPKQAHAFLMKYLKQLDGRGELRVEDPTLSAGMFFSMLRSHVHLPCLLGLRDGVSAAEQKKLAEFSVGMFLKAHAR